ncbi:amidohydrolase [Pseudoalteromonas sp. SMS1]|uniref:amidohydrolase family protein n=1 Tax=Pseudoalteromonas sp. SMS1 TaxID=2908894 RepID=UPI001F188A35|nr:amidohydrolase family protein [Pseudoalteromonas sp. SMS1]MCF2858203.1 amidohydrolase [Pseudoalteromonas sp. SMS1]
MSKYKIIDVDRHVIEPLEMWQQYVSPEIYEKYPIWMKFDTEEKALARAKKMGVPEPVFVPPEYMIGQHETLLHWGEDIKLACLEGNNESERKLAMYPDTQLDKMTKDGIHRACILPTFGNNIIHHEKLPDHVSVAFADAYNKWLRDYCALDPEKLIAVGVISRHDPKKMLDQLRRIIDYGWSCIALRPEKIRGRLLGDPEYEAFWDLCDEHNISVAIHGGTHAVLNTVGTDHFTSHFALHACSHPMEAQMAFVSLLESGVLERHPNLKFAFLEAGASWLPSWLCRLDTICFPQFRSLTRAHIKQLPSEYFKRQCWIAIEPGEPNLREVINWVGHEKLIFGSDFPHPDHEHIDTTKLEQVLSMLTDDEVRAILEVNPVSFLS